jgi:hypothetical protein
MLQNQLRQGIRFSNREMDGVMDAGKSVSAGWRRWPECRVKDRCRLQTAEVTPSWSLAKRNKSEKLIVGMTGTKEWLIGVLCLSLFCFFHNERRLEHDIKERSN